MNKPRLAALDYMRGIAMLGVIAIHVGSQYLTNPSANMHLTALFEIVSRFSVPIFFFISGFGLFYNLDIEDVDYKKFYRRRFKAVLIPYLVWSLFYMLHNAILYHDFAVFTPARFFCNLFFGFSSYQLYFLVILLWFYLLMPCWVKVVKNSVGPNLLFLLAFQLTFNYYSSYSLVPDKITANPFFHMLLDYRMNYWIFHYIYIFVLGGFWAYHFDEFMEFLKMRVLMTGFFLVTLCGILGYYYYLIFETGYSLESAINTAHQLSPIGVFYTIAASLFFFMLFTYTQIPEKIAALLHTLGHHSYFMYLVHPLFITYMTILLQKAGLIMTAPIAIVYYFVIVILSFLAAKICRQLGEKIPKFNQLTIGVSPKKK